jgi:uncharacterized membrane protein YhaH (DUF805 family)
MVVDTLVPNTVLQMEALAGAAMIFMLVFFVVFVLVPIAGMWKIFTKAGKPGWAAIVPIYNLYVMLQIVGRPGWWIVLMIVPVINIIVGILVLLDLAKAFGKSGAYAIGMFFLPFIFLPMLGFGSSRYQGAPN